MLVIDNLSTRLKTLEQSPGIVLKNWNHETTQLFFATCFTRPTLKTEIIQQPLIISTVGLQIENEWDGPVEHIQFNGFEKGKRNESFCNWDVNSNLCIQLVYQFIIFFFLLLFIYFFMPWFAGWIVALQFLDRFGSGLSFGRWNVSFKTTSPIFVPFFKVYFDGWLETAPKQLITAELWTKKLINNKTDVNLLIEWQFFLCRFVQEAQRRLGRVLRHRPSVKVPIRRRKLTVSIHFNSISAVLVINRSTAVRNSLQLFQIPVLSSCAGDYNKLTWDLDCFFCFFVLFLAGYWLWRFQTVYGHVFGSGGARRIVQTTLSLLRQEDTDQDHQQRHRRQSHQGILPLPCFSYCLRNQTLHLLDGLDLFFFKNW